MMTCNLHGANGVKDFRYAQLYHRI